MATMPKPHILDNPKKMPPKLGNEGQSSLQRILEKNPDGVVVVDSDGIVLYANPAAELLFNHLGGSIIGGHFGFPVMSGEKTEVGVPQEHGIRTAEMSVVDINWAGKSALLASLRDITKRKQMESALETTIGELETFAYTAAHDLKSPLATIQGFTQMLRADLEKKDIVRVQEDLMLIETGVSKMQRILNSVLEYGRAGHIAKPTEEIPFREIVEESLQQVAGQIRLSGARILLAETFPTVFADRLALVRAVNNLIQNSTEYRDKSRQLVIEIGYHLLNGESVYFVRDNGTGISHNQREKVFEAFYRGAQESEGTGLGLTIVKRIVEAHGGRVWIESEADKGTVICFTLAPTAKPCCDRKER